MTKPINLLMHAGERMKEDLSGVRNSC
ncbi:hypothetical protein Goshw_026243 [Gossypium schwendimanii]|uniref:Uncharacterized protein n=1 Tax=Gossypium schwendimanii TaxID=34291 RepID=A0A7J9MK25_GOSSC|nr:hypothetical protein [Gossypium schwendimanii]